jgi:hypothetical protein
MTHPSSHECARRSSRVLVSLPLSVAGQTSDGARVSGHAQTVVVNRHGAKIRSSVPLETRMEVRVSLLEPFRWQAAKVVWADPGQNEYGIELQRPENFWGIHFPPEDWESRIPVIWLSSVARDRGEICIPQSGTTVTLRGESANGTPFQEEGLLVPVGDCCGAIMVSLPIGLNVNVSVIFEGQLVEGAAIAAIAHPREENRCRIWLQFARSFRVI